MSDKVYKLLQRYPYPLLLVAALGIAFLSAIGENTTGPALGVITALKGLCLLVILIPLFLLIALIVTGASIIVVHGLVLAPFRGLISLHNRITAPARLRANRLRLAAAGGPSVPPQIIERINAEAAPKPPPQPAPATNQNATKRPEDDETGPPIEAVPPPDPERAKHAWDELILPESVKLELQTIQGVLEDPIGFREAWGDKVGLPKGMILTGPPGTGKTTIAKALAASAGYSFYVITPADAKSMWHGKGEKRIKQLYATARRNAPAIVFWDEMDAVASKRTEGPGSSQAHNSLVNQILQEIDGFETGDQVVFTAAATNRPDMLDDAIRSRLNYQIEVPLPIPEARQAMIKLYMGHFLDRCEAPLEGLVERTDGMSGRDIKNLAQAIAFACTANKTTTVTEKELALAFERVKTNDTQQKNYLS